MSNTINPDAYNQAKSVAQEALNNLKVMGFTVGAHVTSAELDEVLTPSIQAYLDFVNAPTI
jgi:hypothetical protein